MPISQERQQIIPFIAIALLCTAILIALSFQLSLNNIANDLEEKLQAQLPTKITDAGLNNFQNELLNNFLVSKVNQDLALIKVTSHLNIIESCQAKILSFLANNYQASSPPSRTITLNWLVNDHSQTMSLGLNCQYNWFTLGLSHLLFLILAGGILSSIAKPLKGRRKQLVALLTANGLNKKEALKLCQACTQYTALQNQALDLVIKMNPSHTASMLIFLNSGGCKTADSAQLSWFQCGLQLHPDDIDQAINIALSPATLSLSPSSGLITIHGIEIKLATTPFLYYLWYAQRRLNNEAEDQDGWFINPPSNRADFVSNHELISLMRQHGGHVKAIKDLEEKGLRAKTLDQNRSKIKEEITRVLGEQLAKPFLFDVERDHQTARFKYRLALTPNDISLA